VPKEVQALESEGSAQKKDEAAIWIAYYRAVLESLPTLELIPVIIVRKTPRIPLIINYIYAPS